MANEFKRGIQKEVAEYKLNQKKRKEELAAMSADMRKQEQQKDNEAAKQSKKTRKLEISQLPKPEKKAAKKHDKTFKKIYNRPVRFGVWAVVLCLILYVGFTYGPLLGDIMSLMGTTVNSNTPEGIKARENAALVSAEIANEGIVLLKNDGNSLPLANSKINVFGIAANDIRYGGGGSGAADQSSATNLYQGLNNAGISVNEDLRSFYEAKGGNKRATSGLMQIVSMFVGGVETDEPEIGYLTDDIVQTAKAYSNNALVVIASEGVEASDLDSNELKLTKNKEDLLNLICANFDNVIVVVNAGNAIELGFLEEYDSIKAALWIGTPGPYGCDALGKIMAGQINPSGRLTDTYAYDQSSNPASINFGDYSYSNMNMSFINYNEGIYVGYRYYETYYQGNEDAYNKAVQFPFGYGLSYTDFNWELESYSFDKDTISVDVKVTNTGTVAGKDVVQLYFSAPYTPGGIEKSAVELGGYAKTKLLEQGQSETVTISFATRDMSSYDMSAEQAYVLDKGTYQIKVSRNVHDAVMEMPFEVAEAVFYKTDEVTGTAISNYFDYADSGLTYLSRNDWSGTYPNNSNLSYAASKELKDNAARIIPKDNGTSPATGVNNGIKLGDLKGLAYDDPKWELFLDQFTIDEMKQLITRGAYKTVSIDRLGVPSATLLDGPAGINFFFGDVTAMSYPTVVVIASTWNDELAYRMGEAVGIEANAYNVHGWYAPGMNIHRTPQGGRNFEYYSEDPLLSGKMSAAMVKGAQSRDILVFMKHFALNDQETNARTGIYVWANEQAIRELYLRPFEITVKEGEVTGAMSSFVHMGHVWCGGSPELLQNVLRNEWGFVGVVTTDAVLGSFMDLNKAVRYGNDLMLDPVPTLNGRYFNKLYKGDPVAITKGARERVHNICYSLLRTKLYVD